MMNLLHSKDFIFNCDYVFTDRFNSQTDYFSSPGTWYAGRTWQTNFVADVKNLKLLDWKERGGGGSQVRLELSENTLCGHISEFAVGSYKKAHFHDEVHRDRADADQHRRARIIQGVKRG